MNNTALHIILFTLLSLTLWAQPSKLENDKYNPRDFGQGFSYGVSFLGLGIVGFPIRISNGGSQFEATLFYSPSVDSRSSRFSTENYTHGASLGLGYNIYLGSRNRLFSEKMIKHYIGLKGEYVTNQFQQIFGAVCWRRESYRDYNENASFGFDLGIGYLQGLGDSMWYNRGVRDYVTSQPGIFFRMDLNWFKK